MNRDEIAVMDYLEGGYMPEREARRGEGSQAEQEEN